MTKEEILDDIRCLQTRATSIAHKVQCLKVEENDENIIQVQKASIDILEKSLRETESKLYEANKELERYGKVIDNQNDYIKRLKFLLDDCKAYLKKEDNQ